MTILDRAHDRRGQRRHADRHTQPEHDHAREERRPIGSTDARHREQRQPRSCDQRPRGQEQSRAVAVREPA